MEDLDWLVRERLVVGPGFGFRVSGFGFWVSGFGLRVSGSGFRVLGSRFMVQGSERDALRVNSEATPPGMRVGGVSGFGFRVSGSQVPGLGSRVSGHLSLSGVQYLGVQKGGPIAASPITAPHAAPLDTWFRVSGFGFRVPGSGFRGSGLGIEGFRDLGGISRTRNSAIMELARSRRRFGFRVFTFRVPGFGFRVRSDFGIREVSK